MNTRADSHRLWLQDTVNRAAIRRAQERIQSTGRALPCVVQSVSGQIVTVTFDVISDTWTLPPVTIPIVTSLYDWIPVQVGDKGITFPSDVIIAGLSGLGNAPSVFGQNPGNLSALVFVPVSNAAWTAPGGDANKRNIEGPNGVFLQSIGGAVSGLLDVNNGITFKFGSNTIVIDSTGITITAGTITLAGNVIVEGTLDSGTTSGGAATFNGTITATGDVVAGSISMENHVHLYTPGTGTPTDTGTPTG